MGKKLHEVELTDDERQRLRDLTTRGMAPARRIRRARILLLAAEGLPDRPVAAAVGCCVATVENVRRRFAAERLAALDERPRPGATPKLDGKATATLVGLACTTPPAGRATWTMQLLADKLVELGCVDAVSDETVRRTLKKTRSSPGSGSSGACRS
jgi:putative transposase